MLSRLVVNATMVVLGHLPCLFACGNDSSDHETSAERGGRGGNPGGSSAARAGGLPENEADAPIGGQSRGTEADGSSGSRSTETTAMAGGTDTDDAGQTAGDVSAAAGGGAGGTNGDNSGQSSGSAGAEQTHDDAATRGGTSAAGADASGGTTSAGGIFVWGAAGAGSAAIAPGDLPDWIGRPKHQWLPRLGGVAWLPTRALWKRAVSLLPEYPRPVLVDLKAPSTGFGYRFDLGTWDEREPSYDWYGWNGEDEDTGASPEDIIAIAETSGNAEFVFHVPMPRYRVDDPNADDQGNGYVWQTPEFYGAMVQYLFGMAGPQSEWESLDSSLDFFEQPGAFNWANLRARRGRAEPYPVIAVILGEEPYYIEGWAGDGAEWGAYAEQFREQIRGRGISVPLGLHVREGGPPSDPDRTWFKPLMENLTYDDFSFIDLHHYYQPNAETDAFKRIYPVAVNEQGFQNWWLDRDTWLSDYTTFLWIIEDTRNAIREFGFGDPERFNLGFGEHGLSINSQFVYNDMGAGLSWAAWLAEAMRQNIVWDSAWVLAEQGWSHAQIQIRDGHVTRTPAFYVYQMAQEFYGFELLDSSYPSALGNVVRADDSSIPYPLLLVRVFQNPDDLRLHLFIVNLSETEEARITGLEDWSVAGWKQLHASTFDAMNPIGEPWTEESVRTELLPPPPSGEPIVVAPISVNHIVLE